MSLLILLRDQRPTCAANHFFSDPLLEIPERREFIQAHPELLRNAHGLRLVAGFADSAAQFGSRVLIKAFGHNHRVVLPQLNDDRAFLGRYLGR